MQCLRVAQLRHVTATGIPRCALQRQDRARQYRGPSADEAGPDPLKGASADSRRSARAYKAVRIVIFPGIFEPVPCPCSCRSRRKLAGRLSFTCCVAADRVGRAFIIPMYAQAHQVSTLFRWVAMWWIRYPDLRPPICRRLDHQRQTIRSWTDAAEWLDLRFRACPGSLLLDTIAGWQGRLGAAPHAPGQMY